MFSPVSSAATMFFRCLAAGSKSPQIDTMVHAGSSTLSPSRTATATAGAGISGLIKSLLGVRGEQPGPDGAARQNAARRQISEPLVERARPPINWDPQAGVVTLLDVLKRDETLNGYCVDAQDRDMLVVTYLMQQGQRAFDNFFKRNSIGQGASPGEDRDMKLALGKQAWDAVRQALAGHPFANLLDEEQEKNFMNLASHPLYAMASTASERLHCQSLAGTWPDSSDRETTDPLIVAVCDAYCKELWLQQGSIDYPKVYESVTACLEQGRQDERYGDIRF